jgi:aspartate aminotransferase-like enzyme
MKKTYLLTPGPTAIPESVHATFAKPIIHHRTPEFENLFSSLQKKLQQIFETSSQVLTLSCTGTGAMEAAIVNLFSPGETVITINGGKFGERLSLICQKYQLNVIEIKLERGRSVDLAALEKTLQENPKTQAILFQASETSTGAKMPTEQIVKLSKRYGVLTLCDAITACGVFKLPMDAWGIDVLMTGSQKAFMLPPGLAFIAFSDAAWAKSETSTLPKFYFNLTKEKTAQAKNQTAWSPATSLLQGLDVSLDLILKDGLDKTFNRHRILAEATRAGVQALGLELLAETPSEAVTAVKVPPSITEGKKIPKLLRDRWGITITGGQDELEGKIIRLSHFGYCGPFDIVTAISGLELVLKELGYPLNLGSGVAAVLEKLNHYKGELTA